MADFIESPRFPDSIAYGTSFGPEYFTWVTALGSGYQVADSRWYDSLHRFNVMMPVEKKEEADLLLTLFHVCKGRAKGFRIRDWLDYQATTSTGRLGEADTAPGGVTVFQLTKKYAFGAETYYRPIKKPTTVAIYKNGVLQTLTTHYTINLTTGLVTFVSAPTIGDSLHWVGEFDVPVKFEIDRLQINGRTYGVWDFGQIPIVEMRL